MTGRREPYSISEWPLFVRDVAGILVVFVLLAPIAAVTIWIPGFFWFLAWILTESGVGALPGG